MRIAVTLDKETTEVEIDPKLASARVRGKTVPVKVVGQVGNRVELEIAGEKFVVEGWPDGLPRAPGDIALNGETYKLKMERLEGGTTEPTVRAPAPVARPAVAAAPAGEGVVIVPPMPGRVVEVRVKEGDSVEKGQVVVVLEAMKMRNEVPSPAAGVVRDLVVQAGSNVRAREPMLRIAPR